MAGADDQSEEGDARTLESLIAERRRKRDSLSEMGIDPYPYRYERTVTARDLHARYDALEADTRTGEGCGSLGG